MPLRGRTYYMDMGNRAATGAPKCVAGSSFRLLDVVRELPHLEELLLDDEVLNVWEFTALPFYDCQKVYHIEIIILYLLFFYQSILY